MFYERTDIKLTTTADTENKILNATIHVDLGVEYKKLLETVGNAVYVDFGGAFGDQVLPTNLQQVVDGLEVTNGFVYTTHSQAIAQQEAEEWLQTIRHRIHLAILQSMLDANRIASESSQSSSGSSSTVGFSASIYTSEEFSNTSSSRTETDSSLSSDSSSSGFLFICGVEISLSIETTKSNTMLGTIYHDIGYVMRKKLDSNPNVMINYSGAFAGRSFRVGTSKLKDKLKIEYSLSYTAATYNTCVLAFNDWYKSCMRNIIRALNNLD